MWKRDLGPLIPTLDPEQEREQRLMAQARSGAIWALDALVARYQSTLTRYLTRLVGDKERAEGLTEDVLVRMERRLYVPRPIPDLRLWLLRAATDSGLDALRHPFKQPPRLAAASGPALLPEGRQAAPTQRLRTTLSRLTQPRGARARQSHPRDPVTEVTEAPSEEQQDAEPVDPREAFRRRLVRAVLAELPMEDARCVALHLVAGLNQAEVARTLAMPPSRARAHIVEGLAIFGRQYKAALDTLGIPRELGYGVGFGAEASLEAPPEALPRYRSPFTRLPETPAESGMVVDESGEVVEPGLSEEELRLNAISNQPTVSLVVEANAPWADELERAVTGEMEAQVIPVLSPPAGNAE